MVGDPGGIHILVFNSGGTQVYTTPASPVAQGTFATPLLPPGNYFIQTSNGSALGYLDQVLGAGDCTPTCQPVLSGHAGQRPCRGQRGPRERLPEAEHAYYGSGEEREQQRDAQRDQRIHL